MRGFTVDDALISVRYARHVAEGAGWRFDAGGVSTDGVTPLGWPLVLAALARPTGGSVASAAAVLVRAKLFGAALWAATVGVLGGVLGETPQAPGWVRGALLALLALSVPAAAYAVSGMETPLATALATAAAILVARPGGAGRTRAIALLGGLAASVRPELTPWAVVLAVGAAWVNKGGSRGALSGATIAAAPFGACCLVRDLVWGSPVPLAVLAKPSDAAHGLAYAGAACVVSLVPLAVLAPLAVRRTPRALAIVLASIAHLASIVAAGGDWMPYARLIVPVLPSLVLAGALASRCMRPAIAAARLAVAALVGVVLLARGGSQGRLVGAERDALVAAATPLLAGSRRIASLDIGWVSAATEADILDLAGVTDPRIAILPGGHTSKHIDGAVLVSLEPDAILLYAVAPPPDGLPSWRDAPFARVVEARLAADDVIANRFDPAAWLPLGSQGAGYVLLKAK
jgi:hypothetical protein